jgi:hypothetical protein
MAAYALGPGTISERPELRNSICSQECWGKRFGLGGIGSERAEGTTTVGREGEASSAVITTPHVISFCGLSIAPLCASLVTYR